MKQLNWDDYPLDTCNPSLPVWLSITGRWHREPHNLKEATGGSKDCRKITLEIDGVVHKFKSHTDANSFMGYHSDSGSSVLAMAVKKHGINEYFISMGHKVKVLYFEQRDKAKPITIMVNNKAQTFKTRKDAAEKFNISPQYFRYKMIEVEKNNLDRFTIHGVTYKILNQKVEI